MGAERRDELLGELRTGEALRFETETRGGALGLTDDRVLVVGDEAVSVPFENVSEVTVQSLDWYLILLSVVLLGVAAVLLPDDPPIAVAFALFALVNVYWTYRKRNRVRLKTHSRPRPVTFYVDDPGTLYDALERALDDFRAREGKAAT